MMCDIYNLLDNPVTLFKTEERRAKIRAMVQEKAQERNETVTARVLRSFNLLHSQFGIRV